jgi:hypothetical protein
MTDTNEQPQTETQQPPIVEFRAQSSGGKQSIGLYLNGELDETVFTIEPGEPRDLIARRLAQAFGRILALGAEVGLKAREEASNGAEGTT